MVSLKKRALIVLQSTPPRGVDFEAIVAALLTRETGWTQWKRNGCPSFARDKTSVLDDVQEARAKRKREHLEKQDALLNADGDGETPVKQVELGNAELTRLFSLAANNEVIDTIFLVVFFLMFLFEMFIYLFIAF